MNQELQKLRIIVQHHLENSHMPHRHVKDIFELVNKQQQEIQRLKQQVNGNES